MEKSHRLLSGVFIPDVLLVLAVVPLPAMVKLFRLTGLYWCCFTGLWLCHFGSV